ncbi:MAG TPA: methylated-DNA--[protein]-cysteine S-methyltransferase [Allosphingosinicella sp.]|uniref:methylated-DNA--[protein]-cysteine S-methyltransferase n=1 Tax=Allosphingosinicella sp. TaxID=2823234 RepID=UPI002ED7D26F
MAGVIQAAFSLFDTPIGRCAIVWRGTAVIGSALSEVSNERLRASLQRRFPEAEEAPPPPEIEAVIEAVRRLLNGVAEDFAGIVLQLDGLSDFERAVLEETFRIPAGETRTYGEIAAALEAPGAARAVGAALGRNPIPIIIPCHRVLGSNGKSGGFSAPGGASTKLKMLEIERAKRGSQPELFEHLPWQAKA